jgi:chorismate mutase
LIYIAGPCSAESREQVLETAEQLSAVSRQLGVSFIFRAGVWKPRTSPHTFQGVGEEGLAWLKEVKECYGMEIATEVATPEHVEAALKAGVDYLWIGARSSATPIVVQSLADSICDLRFEISNLKGILIKNPVNNDAGLWIGNIERLEKTGVPVIAVHRGCGHQPCWAMAHAVRLARPDIPMLLDPSHMSGDAKRVPELMKKIEELGLDGAMVEVHCRPEEALSDAKQQIEPRTLAELIPFGVTRPLLDEFWRTPSPKHASERVSSPNEENRIEGEKELNWLRAEIDELDARLWETISARMDVSRRIGKWKKAHDVAPLQPKRFQQLSEQVAQYAKENGLSADFAQEVLKLIHEESLRQQ